MGIDKIAGQFQYLIENPSNNRTAPYDSTATVLKVDGDTAWVHIPGGVEETPVEKTIDAKAGDTVKIRVSGGRAWILGNSTSPPTDDTTANVAVNIAHKTEEKVTYLDRVVTEEVEANKAKFGELEADTAKVHDLTADQLTATVGYISDLTSENVTAQNIIADHATVGSLDTKYATINELHSDYAEIDLANVNNAYIENGVFNTAAIVDEQVFTVTGNKATIKEINADEINVRNLNAKNLKIETADGYIQLGDKKTPTKEFIDSLTDELNDRIDGAIETFTSTAVPTLTNYPANQWGTDEIRATHVGDVCYVVNSQIAQNGYCYRFTLNSGMFSWQLIKDSDVTAALQRLQTAEGKIGDIEAFDEDIASFKTDTEEELSSLKTKTTNLETSLGDKVDKTTFNQVSQKVDENSSSITTLETNVSKKADSSTVTSLTNTVNTVKQTATSNSSKLSSLTTTLGTNADGTTKAGDIVHRTSAVEQDLSGFKTTVSETYATKATVNGKADASTVYTKSEIDQTVSGINASVSAKADGASTTAALALKANKDTLTSEINASADTVKINANRVQIDGTATFNAIKASADAAYDAKGAASTAEANAKNAIPTKVSQLTNDSGYQNATQVSNAVTTGVSGKADKTAAVAEEQYIYISKASGTTSVSGTTTWITEAGDKQNTWTTKRPTYNTSYPVLFVAKQKKVVSGTVTCTTPVKDDTTTVIDGGHITTGTIDSNRLNADTIKVNAANIQGSLIIGQLPSTVAETSDIPTKVSQLTNDSKFQTDTQVSTAVANEANARKATYATSSTAAGTQAKVAACSNFALYTGATITVGFTNANTHVTPTLNVNSTGAKTIKNYTGAALTAAEYKWAAGAALTFVYDGSYWRMQDSGATESKAAAAASASTASTKASEAATSASTASTKASEAATSASTASTKASEASTSASTASSKATSAANSASTASTKASEASTSASTASSKATAAANSATAAENAKNVALDTVTVKDTRFDNQPPSWYISNYPKKRVQEFKSTSKIGLSGDTYCWLQTDVPWADSSGGYPKQTVELNGKQYWRQGTSTSAWSAWVDAYGTAVESAKTATTYITDIDSKKGITVKPSNKTGNDFLQINSSAVSIYRNNVEATRIEDASARFGANANPHTTVNSTGLHVWKGAESTATNEVASFGSNARIGAKVASSSYLELEPNKMALVGTDASNTPSEIFTVGNLLNTTDVDEFTGNGSTTKFELTSKFKDGDPPDLVVKVNNVTKTKGTDYTHIYENSDSFIQFTTAPAADAEIEVSYTKPWSIPYMNFVSRKSGTIEKAGSYVFGYNCEASGNWSHASGYNSIASNYGASADGYAVKARGEYSHAEGYQSIASGKYSHAEGRYTSATEFCSHAEGMFTKASGKYSHAEGKNTKASGENSHAEGSSSGGNGVLGAYGMDSHVEGYSTSAIGKQTHAEGYESKAEGNCSHAEGYKTHASGKYSHAAGWLTESAGECQTVIGKSNIAQGTADSHVDTDPIFIIGNGTASTPSNALVVKWNGDIDSSGNKITLEHDSGDVYYVATRSDTDVSVAVGVGAGGANHGIFSYKTKKWLVYYASDGHAYAGTHFNPQTTSTSTSTGFYLGLDAHRWKQLYCYSAPNVKSDKKDKDIVGDLEYAKEFIMSLKPIEFQWKDSDHKRIHMGFIAQDVAEAGKKLNKDLSVYEAHYKDREDNYYGGEEVDDEKLSWSMMYSELIAPMVKVIQDQEERIAKLETLVEQLLDK